MKPTKDGSNQPMLYVQAPALETIRIANLYGEPMFEKEPPRLPSGEVNPEAGQDRPALFDYQRFLLDRTCDEKFFATGSKKEGIDAIELTRLARKQIAATKGVKGFHAFDSEVATRLQAAILHPTGGHLSNVSLEHNWIEWALLWKTLSESPPAVLNVPDGAGGSAQAQGESP